jgi:type IV pilus assembly protein PilF
VLLLGGLCLLLSSCGSSEKKDSLNPDEGPAELYVQLSEEYLRQGQLEPALQNAKRALAEDNKSGRAHYAMGAVLQRLGREEDAAQRFSHALRLDPDNPDFQTAWGLVLCSRGNYKQAVAEIEKAAKNPLYQTPEAALISAARCAERHNHDSDAEAFARQALSRSPNYHPALFAMAELTYGRGAYAEARTYMIRYSRVGPSTPAALLLAARIERKLGNTTEAKSLEAALRQRFPDAPEIMQL